VRGSGYGDIANPIDHAVDDFHVGIYGVGAPSAVQIACIWFAKPAARGVGAGHL
jgi:hypothetical protein